MAVDATELKVTIENASAWGRRMTITVPADEVERERKTATQRLAQRVRLPGFRKGKVPASVMERRFGAAIQQETLEKVMGEAYREAVRREGLEPITQGAIDQINYEAGSDLTFDVAFEVRPDIELARIGGFTLQRSHLAVTDEQVQSVLDRLRHENAVWQPVVDEAPVAGDQVIVEITELTAAEEEGEAPSPRRYEIVLGEGQALPDIEASIGTLKPTEVGEFTVQLPETTDDSGAATKEHRLRINLLEVKHPDLPPLDDDFARALGEFDDLEDLQQRVRSDLEQEAQRESERQVRQQLVSEILEANPFEVPESMIHQYLERVLPAKEGADMERVGQIRESARPAAESALRRMLVIEKVASMESLQANADEVAERINEVAERLGRSPAEVRRQFARSGRLQEIEDEITEQKVFAYLESLSTVE